MPSERCHCSSGGVAETNGDPPSSGISPSASPVSSSVFIELSTTFQPSAVAAHVLGAPKRSVWTHVRRHTAPTGVISHVTRDAGSAAVSSSNTARNDSTSRFGGSASMTSPCRSRRERPTRATLEEVARRQLGIDQRLPDAVLARLDVGLEDVSGLGHGSAPSRSRLRSTIAAAQGSANFEIHRSWISRIGTGFK